MSYTVLARRYRSGTFDEVVGQDHVARTLKRAIESNRIAHAYLFNGTRGVGKTSMARIMAKALNCEASDGPTASPCQKCASCQAIARGEDIDVIEIDAASNTGVDNVRDIIANAQYRPARSRFKVYIIDEVHMLSKSAFNALLKTLEEPPVHVKFILATTEPEKVLPTILSRCQRYDFRNIPTREIAGHLKNICQQEQIDASDDALLLVAKAGSGSMRDALSLLDRLLSIGEKELTVDTIEQLLGLPRTQLLSDLTQAIGEGRVQDVLTQADKMICDGLAPDSLVASLVDHLRNLLVIRTCGMESKLVEVAGLSPAELKKQAQQFDPVVLTQDITLLEDLRRHMRQSQAGRALLDATLVRMALAEQFTAIGELLNHVDSIESSGETPGQKKKPELRHEGTDTRSHEASGSMGEAPVSQQDTQHSPPTAQHSELSTYPDPQYSPPDDDDLPRPGKVWDSGGPDLVEMLRRTSAASTSASAPPASDAPTANSGNGSNLEAVDERNLPAIWRRVLDEFREQNGTHALLQKGQLEQIDGSTVILRYSAQDDAFPKMLSRNGKVELVNDALSRILNRSVGVKFAIDEAAAAPTALNNGNSGGNARQPALPRPAASEPERSAPPSNLMRPSAELRAELEKDPTISAVIQELGGTIEWIVNG